MRRLDPQERAIVSELIRNPRQSDNAVGRKTSIPVMTVNRKRKRLENEGLLSYYTVLDTSLSGTGLFQSRNVYLLKFKIGITASYFLSVIEKNREIQQFNEHHIDMSFACEKDGHFALLMIMDALNDSAMMENFNGFIVPQLKKMFGNDAIEEITTLKVHSPIRLHHNYMPLVNMGHGVIEDKWDDDRIFVDEVRE